MMMPKQKPVKPAPLMSPSCAPVKPKSAPQLARMPPRIPKPTPAARMAMKPAQSSRLALGAMPSCLMFMMVSGSCLKMIGWVAAGFTGTAQDETV